MLCCVKKSLTIFFFLLLFFVSDTGGMKVDATVQKFTDVKTDSAYYKPIVEMVNKGVINGYEDGSFKPDVNVTRKHAAALINRAVTLEIKKEFIKPKDVQESSPYFLDIKNLMQADLIELDKEGNFNPDTYLTRAEMAKIIANGFHLSSFTKDPLIDKTTGYSFYINKLYVNEITTGYEDNTFRGDKLLTRAHFAMFMYRAMKAVEVRPFEELTEEDFKKMDLEEMAKYILPLRYEMQDYIPEGVEDIKAYNEKMIKEFNRISVLVRPNGFSTSAFSYEFSTDLWMSMITGQANNSFNGSIKTTIEMINKMFLEGTVLSSLDVEYEKASFVIYYDYEKRQLKVCHGMAYEENLTWGRIQYLLHTGMYKNINEVTVPRKAYTAKELTDKLNKEFKEIVNQKKYNETVRFSTINNMENLEAPIKKIASDIKKSVEETTAWMNYVQKTGAIVENLSTALVPYVMYFDYYNGDYVVAYPIEKNDLSNNEVIYRDAQSELLKSFAMVKYYSVDDVELPKGYLSAVVLTQILADEFKKVYSEKNLQQKWGLNLVNDFVEEEAIELYFMDNIEIHMKGLLKTRDEMISLYNQAFLTGEVITNTKENETPFVMYFDYKKGMVIVAF